MRRFTYILISICILTSCENEEREEIIISEEFKILFLREILSDTAGLKILTSKSQLISNYPLMVPPILPTDFNNSRKAISHTKFISDTLGVRDTNFIRQQIIDNRQLDLNRLKKYGFKIFDLESQIKSGVPHSRIFEKVDSINEGTDNHSFLKISEPVFNKDKNRVYIRLEQGSGGETLILRKIDGTWKKEHRFGEWVK